MVITMSDYIEKPYRLTTVECERVSKYCRNGKDWSKNTFSELKGNLKAHLRVQQNNQCCYCKKILGYDLKEVEIEHILPKSKYHAFVFEPKNLALSCPACNLHKGDSDVYAKNKLPVRYPAASCSYKIVHPHFDTYSNHIEIRDSAVYIANSRKGSYTIHVCQLWRLQEVLKKSKIENDAAVLSEIAKLISELTPDAKKAIVSNLNDET